MIKMYPNVTKVYTYISVYFHLYAVTWENISSYICSQRELKSACAQSDQSLRYHEEILRP